MSSSGKVPTSVEIIVTSRVAGIPVTQDVAERIATSIGPAFEGFAPVSGTLSFDLEPETFAIIQNKTSK